MITTRKFKLTQEHIDNGVRYDCKRCIFALCFTSYCPAGVICQVGIDTLLFCSSSTCLKTIRQTEEIRNMRRAFDRGEDVHPVEFELIEDWSFLGDIQ